MDYNTLEVGDYVLTNDFLIRRCDGLNRLDLTNHFKIVSKNLKEFIYTFNHQIEYNRVWCDIVGFGCNTHGGGLFYIIDCPSGGMIDSNIRILSGASSKRGNIFIYLEHESDYRVREYPRKNSPRADVNVSMSFPEPGESPKVSVVPSWAVIPIGATVRYSDRSCSGTGILVGYEKDREMYLVEDKNLHRDLAHTYAKPEYGFMPYDKDRVRRFRINELTISKVSLFEKINREDSIPSWAKYPLNTYVNVNDACFSGSGRIIGYYDESPRGYMVEIDYLPAGLATTFKFTGTFLPHDPNKVRKYFDYEVSRLEDYSSGSLSSHKPVTLNKPVSDQITSISISIDINGREDSLNDAPVILSGGKGIKRSLLIANNL